MHARLACGTTVPDPRVAEGSTSITIGKMVVLGWDVPLPVQHAALELEL
jgi:hypothetical protein